MAEDAVRCEPVSAGKFPANRENNREFCGFRPLRAQIAVGLAVNSVTCVRIPYAMELGNFLGVLGRIFRETGNILAHTKHGRRAYKEPMVRQRGMDDCHDHASRAPTLALATMVRQSGHDRTLSRALPQLRPDPRGAIGRQAHYRYRSDGVRLVALQSPSPRASPSACAKASATPAASRSSFPCIPSRKPADGRLRRSTVISPISAWSKCSTVIRSMASCSRPAATRPRQRRSWRRRR